LGTEAARLALRYAFEGLNLNRVEANVLSSNQASIRLLKRVGFTWEGKRRTAVWKSGRWEDIEIYGITAREWYESQNGSEGPKLRANHEGVT
jgi:RimJ/RimL family protein N-acetyltransferase